MNAMQKAVVKNMEWANSVPTYQVSRAITTDELDALYKEVSANKKTHTQCLLESPILRQQNSAKRGVDLAHQMIQQDTDKNDLSYRRLDI